MTEVRGQKKDDRDQRSEDRSQKLEDEKVRGWEGWNQRSAVYVLTSYDAPGRLDGSNSINHQSSIQKHENRPG